MKSTRDDLIQQLATDLKPVSRLAPISFQLSLWLAFAIVSSLSFAYVVSLPLSGFEFAALRLGNAKFWMEQMLLLSCGGSAGLAALLLSRPGRSERLSQLICYGTLGVWSVLGMTYLDSIITPEFNFAVMLLGYKCLIVSAASAIPVGLSLTYLVKKGFILNKKRVLFFSMLASTAVGAFALQFFCPQVTGSIKLFWHILPIYFLSTVSAFAFSRMQKD